MKHISLAILLILHLALKAQDLKVIKATKQEWSGGVAGRYGENYYIKFQTKNYNTHPDSVWIGGDGFKMNFEGEYTGSKRKIDSVHHIVTYSFSIGTSHDEYADEQRILNPVKSDSTAKPHPVRHFAGEALITYSFQHKKKTLIVKQFQTLEPIAYP